MKIWSKVLHSFYIGSVLFIVFVCMHITTEQHETLLRLEEQNKLLQQLVDSKESKSSNQVKTKKDKKAVVTHVIACENNKSHDAMMDVASVIYNRAKRHYKEVNLNSLHSVVVKPGQFECLNKKPHYSEKHKKKAMKILSDILSGNFKPTIDALYFHAEGVTPKYTKTKEFVARKEGHYFYR